MGGMRVNDRRRIARVSTPANRHGLLSRLLRRDRRATILMEMALCGPPFLFGISFLVELGYDMYAQEMLDYGLQQAARQIQLGNAQNAATAAIFKSNYFCPVIAGLLDCNSVSINVNVIQAAGSPTYTDYYLYYGMQLPWKNGSGGYSTTGFTYCPGQPNDLMLASAIYTSPSVVSAFVPGMPTMSGQHVTLSTVAFINEDYPNPAGPPAGCPS
jgi:hypothetical protein